MDKRVSAFVALDDADEFLFWQTRTPDDRLAATELLRRINYGDSAITARLQRVFEFAELRAG
jgi:hypothetical protein